VNGNGIIFQLDLRIIILSSLVAISNSKMNHLRAILGNKNKFIVNLWDNTLVMNILKWSFRLWLKEETKYVTYWNQKENFNFHELETKDDELEMKRERRDKEELMKNNLKIILNEEIKRE
jgi:hypothetical protein